MEFIAILIYLSLDVYCYIKAKYPERTKWFYKLPGGGIIAFIILGEDNKGDNL